MIMNIDWNDKTKLSNFEVYGNETNSNDEFIYYNDLTCIRFNNKFIKYYKLEKPLTSNVNINQYKKIMHREDGPANVYANGNKEWYLNGKLHRVDGPAIEGKNGNNYWFLNDEQHREDGPACDYADGSKEWYLYGIKQTSYKRLKQKIINQILKIFTLNVKF